MTHNKKGKRKGKRYPREGVVEAPGEDSNVHPDYFKKVTTTITGVVQPNKANEALSKMRGENNE